MQGRTDFCNVCFDDSGSAIMCLADEDQYEFGDCVYVEGIDEIGQIESVEYHKKKMHPYPCGKSDIFSANTMIFEKAYLVTLTNVYESLNFDFGKRRNMP